MLHSVPAVDRGYRLPLNLLVAPHRFAARPPFLERLEKRVLLSAVFVPTTANLHDIQNGPLAKAGGNLADLYLNFRTAQRTNTLRSFDAAAELNPHGGGGGPDVVGYTVGVELVGIGSLPAFERSMESLGLSVQSITPADNAIAGFLPITMLRQVAQGGNVLHITPLEKPAVYQEGEAPDQADQTMQALEAKSTNGLTGAGVTVGVISDSVNQVGNGLADSEATGDLPDNVKVIHDGEPGDTDEGRAILEEIHDLAPAASLVFDTSGDSEQSMANAIAALQAAGCNVIVDDIGFPDEPFFQPGVIDRAIDKAVDDGITYITAAGNDGTSGFEQAANFVSANDGTTHDLINFNPGGTAATRMNITITDAGQLTFEWDDAYNGVTGTVNADLEINLYSSDGVLRYSGASNAFATGVPVQDIDNVKPGNYQVEIVAINTPAADLPRDFEFTGDFIMTTTQYSGLRTSIVGHAGFSDSISVGAVPFYDVPHFSSSTPIPAEDYSSAGPVIESRDINGVLLPTDLTIDKPDLSGVDGNNTSFFGSPGTNDPNDLPQFFGTSAAAGNVAGVVALLKQADPSATQAQILLAMKQTAISINGQAAGAYDSTAGYGLVDAAAAVTELNDTVAPIVTIAAVSPNPALAPVNTIDINFSQPVNGVTLSDLSLTLAGGANLLSDNQTLTSSNSQNFVLGNLSSLTTSNGQYTLTLTAAGSGITGSGGQALQSGASTSFTEESPVAGVPAAPTGLIETAISGSSIALAFSESSSTASGFVLERSTTSTFKKNLIRIPLQAGSTTYTDTGLTADTVYYYRVEAFDSAGTSSFTRGASATTLAAGDVIVDNAAETGVTVSGAWSVSTAVSGYVGTNYLQDDESGKGAKSVKFHPNLATAGKYFVYANWTRAADRAKNVPFDVYSTAGALLKTVRENERSSGGNGWVLLGEFTLHSSTASVVRIRNTGTSGEVIADAIEFVPASQAKAVESKRGAGVG